LIKPLVSVITVTYNAIATVESSILSVLAKQNGYIEYIIIDGGSTDGTVDVLEKYDKNIDYWISESDHGIYDAMNKGIAQASGEFLYFLGADDILLNIPFGKLKNVDLLLGNVDLGFSIFSHTQPFDKLKKKMRFRNAIHPQGTFYKKLGIEYRLDFKACSDYAFNIEYIKSVTRVEYIDDLVASFSTAGASSGLSAKKEIIGIAMHEYGLFAGIKSLAYHTYSAITSIAREK